MTLRQAAGQVLVVGLEGTQLSAMEAAWLRLLRPGGVILFRRNIESAAQTHALLRSKQAVDRSAAALHRCRRGHRGPAARSDCAHALALRGCGHQQAGAVREAWQPHRPGGALLGLNTTFAPVLDLRTASEPVMTTRVVSGDPAQVIATPGTFSRGWRSKACWAAESISRAGQRAGGLAPCHSLITKPFDLLWKEDLLPYRRLAKQLPMVMVSHAVFRGGP
jgi:beta-N-acetylhexosaminidase